MSPTNSHGELCVCPITNGFYKHSSLYMLGVTPPILFSHGLCSVTILRKLSLLYIFHGLCSFTSLGKFSLLYIFHGLYSVARLRKFSQHQWRMVQGQHHHWKSGPPSEVFVDRWTTPQLTSPQQNCTMSTLVALHRLSPTCIASHCSPNNATRTQKLLQVSYYLSYVFSPLYYLLPPPPEISRYM